MRSTYLYACLYLFSPFTFLPLLRSCIKSFMNFMPRVASHSFIVFPSVSQKRNTNMGDARTSVVTATIQ